MAGRSDTGDSDPAEPNSRSDGRGITLNSFEIGREYAPLSGGLGQGAAACSMDSHIYIFSNGVVKIHSDISHGGEGQHTRESIIENVGVEKTTHNGKNTRKASPTDSRHEVAANKQLRRA